nr:hypothetical protein BCU43_25145 [Vibrio lentus]
MIHGKLHITSTKERLLLANHRITINTYQIVSHMAFTMISMEIVGITGMFTQKFLDILDIGWELRRETPI